MIYVFNINCKQPTYKYLTKSYFKGIISRSIGCVQQKKQLSDSWALNDSLLLVSILWSKKELKARLNHIKEPVSAYWAVFFCWTRSSRNTYKYRAYYARKT